MDTTGYLHRAGLLEAFQIPGLNRKVISRAAFNLYVRGLARSTRAGTGGLVTYDQLDSLDCETTLSAMELCVLGLWERSGDGYRITNIDDMTLLLEAATAHRGSARLMG